MGVKWYLTEVLICISPMTNNVEHLFIPLLAICISYLKKNVYLNPFFYKFIYFIYVFLAALGLHCCAWAFSSCGERGLLFVAVRRLLIAVASLVAEHRL